MWYMVYEQNKLKMAYSHVMDYHGLSWTIMDCHGLHLQFDLLDLLIRHDNNDKYLFKTQNLIPLWNIAIFIIQSGFDCNLNPVGYQFAINCHNVAEHLLTRHNQSNMEQTNLNCQSNMLVYIACIIQFMTNIEYWLRPKLLVLFCFSLECIWIFLWGFSKIYQ